MNRLFLLMILLFSISSFSQGKSRGNAFNPDISANALFLYQNSNRGNDSTSNPKNGISLDEFELQLTSNVDTYFKLNALTSLHKEGGEWKFEPEEIYAESLSIPSLILKVGKMKAAVGKYNAYHKHAYPFLDQNLI